MTIRSVMAWPFRVLHKTCLILGCIFGLASYFCALAFVGIEEGGK